jgi:hypothetical protein
MIPYPVIGAMQTLLKMYNKRSADSSPALGATYPVTRSPVSRLEKIFIFLVY